MEGPDDLPVDELGPAALDNLLDRGDLADWQPLVRAIRRDPFSELANTVMRLCDAHEMYGTSTLWRSWIIEMRAGAGSRDVSGLSLAGLRKVRGVSQVTVARNMGIAQSDVSKLERRSEVRVSTMRSYVEALSGRLRLSAEFPGAESVELQLPGTGRSAARASVTGTEKPGTSEHSRFAPGYSSKGSG